MQLDQSEFWNSSAGEPYIGWPADTADAMLLVFEEKIPELQAHAQRQAEMIAHQRYLSENLREQVQAQGDIAESWQDIAESRKLELQRSQDHNSPVIGHVLWGVLGLAVGVAAGTVVGIIVAHEVPK